MRGIRRFVDEGLGHSSYVIELCDGGVAIIDPPRFATEHLAAARALGAVPRWTIDTHSHADNVTSRSCHGRRHVPGALDVELGSRADHAADIPSGPVNVMCGHGERAMIGAGILARRGRRGVAVVDGGPDSWAAATGRPQEVGS